MGVAWNVWWWVTAALHVVLTERFCVSRGSAEPQNMPVTLLRAD